MQKYRVIDLFSGVGGLSLGFKQAGFDIVLANEYDEIIANSYTRNHPNTNMIVGDITKIDLKKTFLKYKSKIDVIIGGPPCQGFSQKGKRKSILDERNYLFKYYIKVIEIVKPKCFLMENVPNILTTESGYFKNELETLFFKLGYSINMTVLNAGDYGVPQNRHRAIILGALNGNIIEFPQKEKQTITIWDAISDLAFLNSGEGDIVQDYRFNPKSKYQEELRKGSKRLYNHIATNHSKLAIKKMSLVPANGGKDSLPKEYLTKSIYSGTWCRMHKFSKSVTITTRFDTPSSGEFTHPSLNRAITVREAARLQSFPDTFVFYGTKSSQMKQVGNAVPPKLAYSIAKQIKKYLKRGINEKTGNNKGIR